MELEYNVKRLTPYTLQVTLPFKAQKEHWFMLSSDHHWDNPKCNRGLLKKDMDWAVNKGAGIFSFGDLFCAMEGKGDRRSSKNIRPEHASGNYLDALVDTASEYYGVYSENIICLADGNHETSVKHKIETDLTERLCESIRLKTGNKVYKMPYAGWILFKFVRSGGKKAIMTIALAYTHGHGGGGIVTKGTLWPTRKAAFQPDADINISGHIHEKWYFPVMTERIDARTGVTSIREKVFLCSPTYKEEYLGGAGYHREKGRPPKPLGCWRLRLRCEHGDIRNNKHNKNKEASVPYVSVHVEPSVKSTIR